MFEIFFSNSLQQIKLTPFDIVLLCHFVRQLNIGVTITEASHIGHLSV